MFDFPLHLYFGLKFRDIKVPRKSLTRIDVMFHDKQEKIQSAFLDGGQRGYSIGQVE